MEITGGEPLLQDEVFPLMETLMARGHTVMLETGGHRPLTRVPKEVIKIMDVKCPGSGEADKNHWDNLALLTGHDEVKFVVKDRVDYEFAREVIARHDLPSRVGAVLMSPVHGVLDPRVLSEWMLADHLPGVDRHLHLADGGVQLKHPVRDGRGRALTCLAEWEENTRREAADKPRHRG